MRKILCVIDMQNDFITGSLGTKEAQSIVPNVVKKIAEYPDYNIFATRDCHDYDKYLTSEEGKHLPVRHCIQNTWGYQIEDSVQKALRKAEIIDKPTFASLKLADRLRSIAHKEEIEITFVGLCTDICVISNALLIKAYLPEVPLFVDASCCAGVTPEKHKAALEALASCQVTVLNNDK